MKSPITPKEQQQLVKSLFKGILTPRFLIRQVTSIRSLNDIEHLTDYAIKFILKLGDFS